MLFLYLSLIDDENDKSKFEELYDLYRERMMHMALSVLHNNEDAEDVVHETFIAIARNMKSIDEVDSKRTLSYVLKATKNLSINQLKKNNKSKDNILYLNEDLDIPDNEYYAKLDIEERYKDVVVAILAMDEIYRDVLFYHFVYDMKAKEIADLLNRKLSTVKQQLVRGKKQLLEKLGEDYGS